MFQEVGDGSAIQINAANINRVCGYLYFVFVFVSIFVLLFSILYFVAQSSEMPILMVCVGICILCVVCLYKYFVFLYLVFLYFVFVFEFCCAIK